jgi:hypothetical protein
MVAVWRWQYPIIPAYAQDALALTIRGRTMNKKQVDVAFLALFVVLVVIRVFIVANNSLKLFPDTEGTIIGVAVMVFLSGAVMHHYIKKSGGDLEIAQWAKLGVIAIGAAAFANVLLHYNLAREIKLSEASRVEIQSDKDAEAERIAKINKSYALAAQAEAARLKQLPQNSSRRSSLPVLKSPERAATAESERVLTPAEVREKNVWKAIYGAGIELLICFLAISIVVWKYGQDSDGNGQADWRDRQDAARSLATPGGKV